MKNNLAITPIILAGGSGSRLWPLSRNKMPKQFHALNGNKTLFQQTILRLKNITKKRPVIICNEDHKFIVKDQISEINKECEILLEPVAKNTAPAIALAVLLQDSKTNLLILPSDHMIEDQKIFEEQIRSAYEYLNNNKIVIFGIKPNTANTNYGYIQAKKINEAHYEVVSFKEKPNLALAKKYLKEVNYFWNSGMFLLNSSTFLKELDFCDPQILHVCKQTIQTLKQEAGFKTFSKNIFIKCPEKSIDYSIMEYTKNLIMVPLVTNWSDLGTWNSLMEISQKNDEGNVLKGKVFTVNSKNSMILSSSNKIIATSGIQDLIVIDTKDALLISSKEEISIKPLVELIKTKNPEVVSEFLDQNRPWGSFESISKDTGYQVKKIIVKPGGQLSLQKHKYRSEHWVVIFGEAEVTKGEEKFKISTNESVYIPKNVIHSIKNNGLDNLVIIEVQTGNYLEEDDIERLHDIYGRD